MAMRKGLLHRVSTACAILGLCHSAGIAADRTCATILAGAAPRQLFILSGKDTSPQSSQIPMHRVSQLKLAYIIPADVYASGVVIIKLRHYIQSAKPLPNPTISLHRDNYRRPCVGKNYDTPLDQFEGSSDTQRYINYHRYGLPDDKPGVVNLDRLHAELGNRPPRVWYESDSRCASTADWDIAPQFLFEDNFADRQPTGFFGYFGYRVSSTYEAANQETAYAAPLAYSGYQGLAVLVKPFRKPPNSLACVNFTVDHIPNNASQTNVMIIDADDARFPPANPFQDPQITWSFNWQ
jgi:hypothetical protein